MLAPCELAWSRSPRGRSSTQPHPPIDLAVLACPHDVIALFRAPHNLIAAAARTAGVPVCCLSSACACLRAVRPAGLGPQTQRLALTQWGVAALRQYQPEREREASDEPCGSYARRIRYPQRRSKCRGQ